jgi:hypothetical protein
MRKQGRGQQRLQGGRRGQALVEACIGLALMALVWVLMTHVCYMRINHVRTVMASRHAAWLAGHKEDTASSLGNFFNSQDAAYAGVSSESLAISAMGKSWSGADASAVRARVTFGVTLEQLDDTNTFPFALMKAELPFMPSLILTNYLSVDSQCVWPADVGNTWKDKSEAFKGVLSELINELGGVAKWIGSLFT